uniref:DUF834 domain-containing protein n=1 Tax=Leersia perrieri TaxID=77586 RepID=A0A0D9V5W0_9ORYZ
MVVDGHKSVEVAVDEARTEEGGSTVEVNGAHWEAACPWSCRHWESGRGLAAVVAPPVEVVDAVSGRRRGGGYLAADWATSSTADSCREEGECSPESMGRGGGWRRRRSPPGSRRRGTVWIRGERNLGEVQGEF